MRKQLLFLSLLLAMSISIHAVEKVSGVIIELTSGGKVEIAIASNPQITYDGTTIRLSSSTIKTVYTPADIAKVYVGEVDSSVSAISTVEATKGTMVVDGGFIRLSGFAVGTTVNVFTLGGVQTNSFKTDSNGSLNMSLTSLPKGVSIIKTNNESIKITRQ